MLTNADVVELTALRRALHRRPEVSREEVQTAAAISRALADLGPARILTGLGGHGVAGLFDSGAPGPTVLFRAELDALPIAEISDAPWASEIPGQGHLCGHDGHMCILLALGRLLARRPVARGRVVLMFQPAEEDGSGARAVVADPAFREIAPDWAFAIHNRPGQPFGTVSIRPGLMNCASLGLRIRFTGKTAHAADPQSGCSPVPALAELVPRLSALGPGGDLGPDFRLATICHLRAGVPAFGIAPGEGEALVTLRSAADAPLQEMLDATRSIARRIAAREGLSVHFDVADHFAASVNHPEATAVVTRALDKLKVPSSGDGLPMRASEDFGVFGWDARAAMICLGTGVDHPALHNPDYDFPDDLIAVGASIFERIARDLLGAVDA